MEKTIGYRSVPTADAQQCAQVAENTQSLSVATRRSAENAEAAIRLLHRVMSIRTRLTSELTGKGLEAGQEAKTANPEPSNLHWQIEKTSGILANMMDVIAEIESWL